MAPTGVFVVHSLFSDSFISLRPGLAVEQNGLRSVDDVYKVSMN